MKWPPKKAGVLRHTPDHPKSQLEAQINSALKIAQHQVCAHKFARPEVDSTPLVCSAQKSRDRESRALLCTILGKLCEIEAQLKSPLAVRQLHLRYCCKCRERVTNKNVGGYDGRSALTGRLYCDLCADELEDAQ